MEETDFRTVSAAMIVTGRSPSTLSDEQMQDLSWSDFVSVLDKSARPELIEYLKMRRLYVNEPQNSEKDV